MKSSQENLPGCSIFEYWYGTHYTGVTNSVWTLELARVSGDPRRAALENSARPSHRSAYGHVDGDRARKRPEHDLLCLIDGPMARWIGARLTSRRIRIRRFAQRGEDLYSY